MKSTNCLVCNIDSNLSQHHIVPQRYLNRIGNEYSVTVTLCRNCHDNYERRADRLTKSFRTVEDLEVIQENAKRTRVIRAALFLIKIKEGKVTVPDPIKVIAEKESIITDYLQELDLVKASKLKLVPWRKPAIENPEEFAKLWVNDFIAFCKKRKVDANKLDFLNELK